ncbi:MAG: Ig-like domain-containing protein [Phycisphaerae bacterium]
MNKSLAIIFVIIAAVGGTWFFVAWQVRQDEVARFEEGEARPWVVSVEPPPMAVDVPTDTQILARLAFPVPDRTAEAESLPGNVRLTRRADGMYVPADVSVEGSTIILRPAEPLESGTEYAFTLTTGVRDTAGRALAPVHTTFTTVGE